MSRIGYVIMYTGLPVFWCIKLQKKNVLSTTKSEYIALSQAVRDVIPFMMLMKEILFIFNLHFPKIEIFYKVFEDHQSCIAVAESKKCLTRIKQIAIKHHHLQIFAQRKNRIF